jgi:hypothetical protein
MADTKTAESAGRPSAHPGTEAAQRARARMEEDNKMREQRQKEDLELAQKATSASTPEERLRAADAIKQAAATRDNLNSTGSPTGTVSAKENQPVATPVDTAAGPEEKEGETLPTSGVAEPLLGVDKNADMPYQGPVVVPAPTQDPPLNVSARVPVGSARVDLTKHVGDSSLGGAVLQGRPGGHLGSFEEPPPAEHVNPPVRQRGGATEPVGAGVTRATPERPESRR